MSTTERQCEQCHGPMTGRRPNARFCSTKCWELSYKPKTMKSGIKDLGLNPGTTGALSEMVVIADLIRRHCEVFKAVSPSSPCDLLVLTKSSKIFRVEVRTGYTRGDGNGGVFTQRKHAADILAIVVYEDAGTHRVVYEPDLPADFLHAA